MNADPVQLASYLRRDVEGRPQMRDLDQAAALIESQAAEIAELRAALCGVPPAIARNAILAWTRDPIGWGMGEVQLAELKAAIRI